MVAPRGAELAGVGEKGGGVLSARLQKLDIGFLFKFS